MNCPRCGSPVMVFSDGWACGWCGDSCWTGSSPLTAQRRTLRVRFLCSVDLPKAWEDLKNALVRLVPDQAPVLLPGLSRVAVHQLSLSPPPENGFVEPQFLRDLHTFLETEKDLDLGSATASDMECRMGLFAEEASLSEDAFGSFWHLLLDALETAGANPRETDTDVFFRTLALFGSWRRGGPGNDPDYFRNWNGLQNAFHRRWEELNPEE